MKTNLPADAKLFQFSEFFYHDSTFAHGLSIKVTEALLGRPESSYSGKAPANAKFMAVVVDYDSWTEPPFSQRFKSQPRGWGGTLEEAIESCVNAAKTLRV